MKWPFSFNFFVKLFFCNVIHLYGPSKWTPNKEGLHCSTKLPFSTKTLLVICNAFHIVAFLITV